MNLELISRITTLIMEFQGIRAKELIVFNMVFFPSHQPFFLDAKFHPNVKSENVKWS